MNSFRIGVIGYLVDNYGIEHAEGYGFDSEIFHPRNLNGIKDEYGIPPRYRSCHTAVSPDGYVFEGHIPAKIVREFLESPPEDAIGLTVPAMPVGSPGMEVAEVVVQGRDDVLVRLHQRLKSRSSWNHHPRNRPGQS